jgi:GAF domain-containing protein
MTQERLRVLLLDDEVSLREPLKKYLEYNFHYSVDLAANGDEALALVVNAQGHYDVALLDQLIIPGPDGIQVMQEIKTLYPDLECIILTGWGREQRQRALNAGAFRYLEKPLDYDELAALIRGAAQQVRLRVISRDILSKRSPIQVLDGITAAACSLAMADEGAIVLADHSTGRLRRHARNFPVGQQWRRHFKGHDLSIEIMRSGRVISVSDIRQDDRADSQFIASGFRSFVGVPIPGEGGSLGVLYVYSRTPGRFDEWETVAMLQTLAGQAGLALTNAEAFEQIRSHANYVEALVRAGQGLIRATDLEDQLALAWSFVREQLQLSTFFVGLYDRPMNLLQFPLVYDLGERTNIPDLLLGEDPAGWGVSGYVVKTGTELCWFTAEQGQQQCLSLGIQSAHIGRPGESCFYLPLKISDEVAGIMSIQSYERYTFDPILLNAFRALGSQLTAAMENARLYAETQLRAHRQETLQKLALTLNSRLQLDEILKATCQAAVEFFNADHSGLVLVEPDLNQGRVLAEYPAMGTLGAIIPLRGVPAEENLMIAHAPLAISAIAGEESLGVVRDILLGFDIQSILIVPVVGRDGQVLGSFSLDAISQPRCFTTEEVELCLVFAAHVAVAIENAGLLNDMRSAQAYIQSLYEASSTVISPTEPGQVLQAIVETACQTVSAWRAVVLLMEEGGQPRILAQAGFAHRLEPATAVRPAGISWQVIRSRTPRFFADPKVAMEEAHPQMLAQGTQSAACLPLLLQDKAIGVLWIQFQDPHPFTEAEKQALQVYANQAAVAYDHARRMRELEHLRQAAGQLASVATVQGVLQQIVRSARAVLDAQSSIIWSYDDNRHVFFPNELVADGIDPVLIERFRSEEPHPGGTMEMVMRQGYLAVTNIEDPQYVSLGPSAHGLRGEIGALAFQGIALQAAAQEGYETLGVLYVNYSGPRSFSDEDRTTLETFAYHAALALKRARLLEQVARVREGAQRVAQATTLGDLQATLKAIVKAARQVLRCDIVSLYTYDETTDRFNQVMADGWWQREHIRPLSRITPKSVLWRILTLQAPFYHHAEDAPADPLLNGYFVKKEEVKSALGVLLRFEGRRVGVMFINYRSSHRFSSDELADAQLFANQAAVAIRNTQLLADTSLHSLQLQTVAEIAKSTSTILDPEQLMKQAVNLIRERFGFYYVGLFLMDEARRYAVLYAGTGKAGQEMLAEGYRLAVGGQSMVGWCIEHAKARVAGDIAKETIHFNNPHLPETRSELALPLMSHHECMGALTVQSVQEAAFSNEGLIVLQTMADQLAIAIENARLYQERLEQSYSLQALYEADQVITSSLAPDEILGNIAEQAYKLMSRQAKPARYSLLALVEGNTLQFARAYPPEHLLQLQGDVGAINLETAGRIGVVGRTVRTRQSQVVSDVTQDSDYIEYDVHTRAELAVPIQLAGEVIGVINVEHAEIGAFSVEDRRLLEALAAQAAIAIRHARRSELQQAIYEASKAITIDIDISQRELLTRILEQAVTRIRWLHRPKTALGLIQLYDEARAELHLESVYPPQEFPTLIARLGERRPLDQIQSQEAQKIGVNGRAVLEGQLRRVSDVRVDPDYVELYPGTLSELDAPLRVGDKVIGVIGLESDRLAAFDEMDEEALQSLADLAALVIQTARQYGELKRAQGIIGGRTALAWLGMTSSAWRHTIEKHALTIREQAGLLRDDWEPLVAISQGAKVSDRIATIERLAIKIMEKPITPPLSSEEGMEQISLNTLVEERARQLWHSISHEDMKLQLALDLPESALVHASPEWLRRAFDILVDNAIEATAYSQVRIVTIGTRLNREGADVFIRDTGSGIPENIRSKIGLDRIEKPEDAVGLGMGLLMAHTIVQAYGGEIRVDATGPTGTTMVIWLPLAN